ncbi:MAG TPA: PAS domain-containing sensor histidine kinase [Pseudobdellovibrionaceae bacterium]|jgi:PAS domain S-box-containing protein
MGPQDSLDFKNIFESVPGAVLVLLPDDPKFTIVAANHAFEKLTKTNREKIIGRGVFEVFPDDPSEPSPTGMKRTRASYRRVMQNRAPDTLAVMKYNIQNPEEDGHGFEEHYWSVANSPVFNSDGSLGYIIAQPEDVTEFMYLKLRGLEQTQLMDELQSETARMQSEIFIASKLYADSQRATQEREYILSIVANDLNSSVSAIKLSTQYLTKKDIQTEEAHSVARNILQSTQIIERLISDMLDFGKIQSGTLLLKKDSESVGEMVKAAMESVMPMALEKRIQLHTDLPNTDMRISCDKNRIIQVLWNLLVNAIRLTAEKGEVKIKACKLGDNVQFSVTDTGPGVAAEEISKIFDRFWQAKELGNFATGLGLAIVKGIIEAHGGEIWLESQLSQGSRFYFTLKAIDHTWRKTQPIPQEPESIL